MNLIELMVVLLILGVVFVAFSVSLVKMVNIDLTKDYVETAVYAGLWKSQLYKDYKSNNYCRIATVDMVEFYKASESCLSGLMVNSFRWAKGGTYSGVAVEPIIFKVSGGEK
ncbi:prepilin-type N-terminal cleavage/methylation domain-containing protein [Fervidobacterium pennivorans subsp. carthaginiensis]|uniref:type II secretion system protein n=1 Tax=Fervidobacterium pennivorans TaxID=93466 RepID=UPI00355C42C5